MSETVNRYRSFITRLTLIVTGILVMAVLVAGSLAMLGQQRQLKQALGTKATSLVQFMAQVTPLGILSLNFVEMNNNVTKMVLSDDEAMYAVILNEQGLPLASFFKDTDPLATSEVRALVKNREPLAAIEVIKRSGRILEVTAPVTAGEKRIGSATLGFSSDKMRHALMMQIVAIGVVMIVIICLSIVLLRVVLRRILHPVQTLTNAATQISSGDLHVVVTGTDRADELGVMSRAFEGMAGRLRLLIAGLEQREEELRRINLFQRTVLDSVTYGIISTDPDGIVTSFNRAAEWLLDYSAEEVVGKMTAECWHDPEEMAQRALRLSEELNETVRPGCDVFAARLRRNLPEENEWTFIRKNGTRFPVLLSMTALRDESGRITGFVGLAYDLTERKRAEDSLRRLNRQLRAISDCNQTLMRATDEQTLLNRICRIICDQAEYRMAWVGYAEQDEGRSIRPVAFAGVDEGYIAEARLSWGETERGRGPAGMAIRGGVTVAVQDLSLSREFAPWLENARKRGYRSGIWLPLKDENKEVFGVLLIYSAEINAFRPEEIVLLEELAGDLAFGIMVLRGRIQRKEAERSIALMNFALNNVREAAFLIDEHARFQYVNEESCRLLGYNRDELLGCTVADVDPDLPLDRWPAHWNELRKKRALLFEGRHRTMDGRIIPVEINANYFEYDGQGYNLALARDITKRKQVEETLREREAFIRNILDSVDEGFIVVDREYRIVAANRAFCEMMKLPEDQVVGRLCHEITHRLARPCFEFGEACAVKRTFESALPHSEMHTHTDANGMPQHVEIKSYPIFDASGAVLSAIETVNDVTERRRLEEQLRQSQKMEAIGTLAGGIAHDFNNILTAIIGYGNIVKMKMAPGAPYRPAIDQILAAADRAAHLTHGLLAFSRKQVINPRPVDLNDIVQNIEKFLRRIIGEDISLSTRLYGKALIAMADSTQIEQVLMNFATNARDAMPGGGALTISTEEIDLGEDFVAMHGFGQPGKYALIAVSDTGQGMDEQTREKIFEPFFTTKELGKGTGLGLAIVYGIIKQHNGNINVYSEPGKGSTFKIYLPLIVTSVVDATEEMAAPPRGGTETIFLAEDDREVRDLTAMILKDYGYKVIEAVDGQDALDKFAGRSGEIDLLLLDVIMPRKSGKEVYDAIKAELPDVAALFISGYTAELIHQKGIADIGVDFISKPVSPFELLRKIREILDRKQ